MSRTKKSIKNILSSILFFAIGIILSFFSRTLFIHSLGQELVGLNTTISNLVGILNLAELGIYSAVSFLLYKPLYEKDIATILTIIALYKKIYRNIGIFLLFTSLIIIPLLPYLITDEKVVWYYPILTFLVMMIGSLSNYFFNYRQILLWANQEGYKATFIIEGTAKIKLILQILCVLFIEKNVYLYWLLAEFLMHIFQILLLEWCVKRNFEWLSNNIINQDLFYGLRNDIYRTIRRIFFYRLSNVVIEHISPLFVYIYINLSVVTIYMNYLLLAKLLGQLSRFINSSVIASIGYLIAEKNITQEKIIFYQFSSIKIFLGSLFSLGFWFESTNLISLIFGGNFILPNIEVFLFSLLVFMMTIRDISETFLFVRGIYDDIFAPIVEMIIYLFFTIGLGYLYEINGIILGIIASYTFILIWKPWYLKQRLEFLDVRKYIKIIVKGIILIIVCYIIHTYQRLYILDNLLPHFTIIKLILDSMLLVLITFILFFLFEKNFKYSILKILVEVTKYFEFNKRL